VARNSEGDLRVEGVREMGKSEQEATEFRFELVIAMLNEDSALQRRVKGYIFSK
jgi:hypothetical protein